MDKRKQIGQQGEDIAALYLQEKGYKIIQRNWRCAIGELDIIAEQGDILIFVEVRTKRSRRYGTAAESITRSKQKRLIELAESYLQERTSLDCSWRIDVIGVQLGVGQPQLNHIENAVGW